ncbi:hypothetical protein ACFL2V_14585 [Pseudomonadota bacterium]
MISRNGLNIVLLLVVAGLALLVYLQSNKELEGEPVTLLASVDTAALNELRLERAGGEAISFRRMGEQWVMPEHSLPPASPVIANKFRVERLLSWFSLQMAAHYDATGLELSKYGLHEPRARLIAGDVAIAFGSIDPLRPRRYVLVGGIIHLAPDNDSSALFAPWTDFVSPRLLPEGKRIISMIIPGLGTLQRGDKGWLYSGDDAPQSADVMQALVDRWGSAQAFDVEHIEGLKGEGTLKINFDDSSSPLTFHVVHNQEVVLLVNPESQIAYQVSNEQAQRLVSWE